ncbi:hypothetical protein BX600DRAFT_534090 [Xylariales sp. PMI_506]|nr:hypothetical protein BX600DRAFT_534090 [Xylariales sp. PMI_506]
MYKPLLDDSFKGSVGSCRIDALDPVLQDRRRSPRWAVGGDGPESARSNEVTASTESAPVADQYILNAAASASADSTTHTAEVIVSYAYVSVYITYTVDGLQSITPAAITSARYTWLSQAFCTRTTTTDLIPLKAPPKFLGRGQKSVPVPVVQDGYSFTWTLPIGTSTMDIAAFVIQTEDYAPLLNYVHSCPLLATSGTYCSN